MCNSGTMVRACCHIPYEFWWCRHVCGRWVFTPQGIETDRTHHRGAWRKGPKSGSCQAITRKNHSSRAIMLQMQKNSLNAMSIESSMPDTHFLIKAFAEGYHSDNPSVFSGADTAFFLAYSTMLLQTALHNPRVKVSALEIFY